MLENSYTSLIFFKKKRSPRSGGKCFEFWPRSATAKDHTQLTLSLALFFITFIYFSAEDQLYMTIEYCTQCQHKLAVWE